MDARADTATAACCGQRVSPKPASSIHCFCARIRARVVEISSNSTHPVARSLWQRSFFCCSSSAAVVWSGNRLRLGASAAKSKRRPAGSRRSRPPCWTSISAASTRWHRLLVRHPAVAALDPTACNGAVCPAAARAAAPEQHRPAQRRRPGRGRRPSMAPIRSRAAPPSFFQVLASGRPAMSQLDGRSVHRPADGRSSGYPVLAPFADGDAVLGIGHQSAAARAAVSRTCRLPRGSIVTLVDRNGRVNRHAAAKARSSSAPAFGPPREPKESPRRLRAARSRRGRAVSRQRGHRSRSLAAERGHPSQRSVGARRSAVASAMSRFCRVSYGLAVTARHVAGARVRRDLTQLRDAAQRIAEGDLSPPAIRLSPNLELARCKMRSQRWPLNLRQMHARRSIDRWNRSARCARCCSRCSARSSGRSA